MATFTLSALESVIPIGHDILNFLLLPNYRYIPHEAINCNYSSPGYLLTTFHHKVTFGIEVVSTYSELLAEQCINLRLNSVCVWRV